jgi:hypothetical protein
MTDLTEKDITELQESYAKRTQNVCISDISAPKHIRQHFIGYRTLLESAKFRHLNV